MSIKNDKEITTDFKDTRCDRRASVVVVVTLQLEKAEALLHD